MLYNISVSILEKINMDQNYTVTITICIISMIILTIDVGKNTILNKKDIKWFRATFILAAIGACCEYFGVFFDKMENSPVRLHWLITFIEFSLSPFLALCLARSAGMQRKLKPMFALMGINVLLEIVSLFTGIIFYIDSNGLFQRGSFYWLYLLFCGISFIYILIVFIQIGKNSKLRNLIIIILIALIMIIGQAANIIDSSINSGYASICVTATLLYICLQNIFRHIMMEKINLEKNISNHDALTKVMSRVSFDNKVTEIDKIIKESPADIKFAVCECDLNNLKTINDSFGHDTGDTYIINCCKTICNFFKHSPVYRIGGDEFVAILQTDDYDNLEQIKEEVLEFGLSEMKKQISVSERKSFASGFGVYNPQHDKSFADVIKRADIEMYENKRMLKNL